MIKAIIFDCFGVLYVHHGRDFSWHKAYTSEGENQIKDLNNQADYGLISTKDLIKQIAAILNEKPEIIAQEFLKGFSRNDRLLDYIRTDLKPKYKVVMFSNISRGAMDKYFTKEELNEYFDDAILSCDIGFIKPRPNAYLEACQLIGVDTSEAVMIDDRRENCVGAEESGLKAIYYEGLSHLKRSLETLLTDTDN